VSTPESAVRRSAGFDDAPEPLSDRERALVARVFSDPFAFPEEYKAWLIAFLEANPPLLITGSIFGFQGAINRAIDSAGSTSPIGTIEAYRFDDDPNETWMICDGRAILRADYPDYHDLAAAASYPDGNGDGSTTVNIPDFRERALYGKGTNAALNQLSDNDGLAVGSRGTPKHTHTIVRNADRKDAGSPDSEPGTHFQGNLNFNTGTDGPGYAVVNHIIRVK
jgi:microcystin-dependent protein